MPSSRRETIATPRYQRYGIKNLFPSSRCTPAIAADYRRQVVKLQSALGDPEANAEAASAIRALIDRIVVVPNPTGRGVTMEVEGRLAGIVALATGREPPEALTAKVERVKGIRSTFRFS